MPASHAVTGGARRQGILFLVILAFVWGGNWPLLKIIVSELPVFTFRAISLGFGGLFFLAIAGLAGVSLRVPRQDWPALIVAGLLNVSGWHILGTFGVKILVSGHAALIGYTVPLWAALIGGFLLREHISRRAVLAIAMGIGGILLLLSDQLDKIGGAPLGAAWMIGAAISWAGGTVLHKRVRWTGQATAIICWQVIIGAVPAIALALAIDGTGTAIPSLQTMVLLGYITLVPIPLGYYLWFRVVHAFPAHIAALGTLLFPLVALSAGAIVLGEPMGWLEFGAIALILPALALVLAPSEGPAAEDREDAVK